MSVYSISNKLISISVNSFGAELVSLKKEDIELIWQADKTIWRRYAPVLFPIVGKLNPERKNDLTQHGFARDMEFILVEQKNNCLEFELTANEKTLTLYPFHFSLRIRYELEISGIKTKYIVFNPNNETLFFSIGAHPGFNCKRSEGESLQDFYLEFENKNTLIAEKLSDGLLSGESYTINLNENKLTLSTSLFNNDALVFKNKQIAKVTLCSHKSKVKVVMECKNWPYFGIWTKKGSNAFVCLEPWFGITDNLSAHGNFESKPGILRLQPNSKFEAQFSIEIIV